MRISRASIAILLTVMIHSLPGEEADVIVMVDISASMNPFFNDLIDYFTTDFMRNVIRRGDHLHFLSFSGSPEIEIVEVIQDSTSLQRVIIKLHSLQPIGLYTDLIAALNFLTDYASALPPERQKKIYLLSDGMHDPSPGSINNMDAASVLADLLSQAQILKREGWQIHILKMPEQDETRREVRSTGTERATADSARDTEAEAGAGAGFEERAESSEKSNESGRDGKSYLQDIASELDIDVIPYSRKEELSEQGTTERATQTDPGKSFTSEEARPSAPKAGISIIPGILSTLMILTGGILAVIALILIVKRLLLLFSKFDRIHTRPGRSSGRGNYSEMIEMKVSLQNPQIGFRNIHPIPKGKRLSVGGGRSNFLIYLVPFPYCIAEISFDGNQYTFLPIKKNIFPELTDPIAGCLEKEIAARSERGFMITINFHRYISPLEKINSILRLAGNNY